MKQIINPGISIFILLILSTIASAQATYLEVEYSNDVSTNGYLCPVVELFDENNTEITTFNYTINSQLVECFETPDTIGNYSITIKAFPTGDWVSYNTTEQSYNYTTHEPNYVESMVNQLWKSLNKDILAILLEAESKVIGGTEYLVGETGEFSMQLLQGNIPNNNAACEASVYYPDKTLYIKQNMTNLAGENGIYYLNFTIPDAEGVYTVSAVCDENGNWQGSDLLYNAHTFHVAEWATLIKDTYTLLQNSIFPSVDDVESKLQDILGNQTNIWDKLLNVENDITSNYNEIIKSQNLVTDANATIMIELLNHRDRLSELNRSINFVLSNITEAILPQLATLKTDVDLLKEYTDSLEAGQVKILANISEIRSDFDALDTAVNQIDTHVTSIQSSLDCDTGSICTRLNELNVTVATIVSNTDTLEAGQANIIDYVDTLENSQTTIQDDVKTLMGLLNCSVSLPNNVCFRLALIENHVDSIEEGQTNISGYVKKINETQNNISSQLSVIAGYTDSLETGISALSSDIENLNTSYKNRFDSIDNGLTNISLLISSIINSGVKLDSATNYILDRILSLASDTNTTSANIKEQLEGTITTYLSEINITTTDTYRLSLGFNQTLSEIGVTTNTILQNWNSYSASDIISELTVMKAQLDTMQTDNSALLSITTQIKAIVDSTRSELGFENKSLTGYEYFVKLDNLLNDVNSSIIEEIKLQSNMTREIMLDAIKANTTALISEINDNELQIYNLLAKWQDFDASDIISNLTSNRQKLLELEIWLSSFNKTEEMRFNESKGFFNDMLAWLGIINQSEKERHNITLTQLSSLLSGIQDTKDSTEEIIALIGYYNTSSTTSIYGKLEALVSQNLQLTSEVTTIFGINEVKLRQGSNLISLPRQPSNSSIEFVLGDIINDVERVDYYDTGTKKWLVFNPKAPFGNTLSTMSVNIPYWIWVNKDVELIVK